MQKIFGKLGEELAGSFANAIVAIIVVLLGAIGASVSGKPEIGVIALAIGVPMIFFLLGLSLGKRPYAQRTKQMEKAFGRGNLCIIGAFYGAKDRWVDVTDVVTKHVKEGQFAASYLNLTDGKDPYPYEPKQLVCVYKHKASIASKSYGEGAVVDLPPPDISPL